MVPLFGVSRRLIHLKNVLFSRTRRTDDADDLAFLYFHINIAQNLQFSKGFRKILYFYNRFTHYFILLSSFDRRNDRMVFNMKYIKASAV